MQFHSSAFGISLRTDRSIPGLRPAAGGADADLDIRVASRPPWLPPPGSVSRQRVHPGPGDGGKDASDAAVWSLDRGAWYHFRYADGTEFVIDGSGRRVWGEWPEGETMENAATYLLGPVMGHVLRLRGVTSLHASVVAIEGRSVAIAGPPGSGKSTLAAAFAREGFPVMSDDVAALEFERGEVVALPGCPRLRLWPDAVTAVFGAGRDLPRLVSRSRLWSGWDKRYLDLEEPAGLFQGSPLPLAGIYSLSRGGVGAGLPVVGKMSRSEGLAGLAPQVYPSFYLEKAHLAQDFHFLGRAATTVPLRLVTHPWDRDAVFRTRDAIVEDLRAMAGAGA